MCGHVGIAGKLEFKDEMTMRRLLVFDYFRGPDSTGLAALRNSGEVKIAKTDSHPLNLFDMKRFKDALSGTSSSVFLGHNRLATKGLINENNAHPYRYGHIVGAHNGTLDKSSWDALNKILGEDTDVDSQAIFACIAKVGVEETLKHLQGAWALVWINTEENTLNFLRNKERSFWYAYTKGFKKVFWASESPIISAAVRLAASGQDYEMNVDEKGYTYWATAENWHYKFDLTELAKGSDTQPKPKVKEIKGKEPTPVIHSIGHHPFAGHGVQHGMTQTPTTTYRGVSSGKLDENKVITIASMRAWRADPFRGYITKEKFDDITNYGCSWCKAKIDYGDVGVVIYEQDGVCLCKDCSGEEKRNRLYVKSTYEFT